MPYLNMIINLLLLFIISFFISVILQKIKILSFDSNQCISFKEYNLYKYIRLNIFWIKDIKKCKPKKELIFIFYQSFKLVRYKSINKIKLIKKRQKTPVFWKYIPIFSI